MAEFLPMNSAIQVPLRRGSPLKLRKHAVKAS
jgi:hypothetical protein